MVLDKIFLEEIVWMKRRKVIKRSFQKKDYQKNNQTQNNC